MDFLEAYSEKREFKNQCHVLFNNMSELVTYFCVLVSFFYSVSSFCSPGVSVLTTSIKLPGNLLYCFDLSLAMNYPCMLQKMSQECALYEITKQFTVCSLSCSFLLLPGSHVCISLWCLHWKTPGLEFVLFLCVERLGRVSQNAPEWLLDSSCRKEQQLLHVKHKW